MSIVGNQGTQLRQDGGIQQVVTGSSIDISTESGGSKDGGAHNVENVKQSSHDPTNRKRVDDVVVTLNEGAQFREHSDLSNVGETVHAMQNAGDLNVPLNKVTGLFCVLETRLVEVYAHSSSMSKIYSC
jgi:hypothetical protein